MPWSWRDCPSQCQLIPKNSKWFPQECTCHIQTNQPRAHTYIISFTKLAHNKSVFLLPLITLEPGARHLETTHTAQRLLKFFKLSHPKFTHCTYPAWPIPSGENPNKRSGPCSLLLPLLPPNLPWCFSCGPSWHGMVYLLFLGIHEYKFLPLWQSCLCHTWLKQTWVHFNTEIDPRTESSGWVWVEGCAYVGGRITKNPLLIFLEDIQSGRGYVDSGLRPWEGFMNFLLMHRRPSVLLRNMWKKYYLILSRLNWNQICRNFQ